MCGFSRQWENGDVRPGSLPRTGTLSESVYTTLLHEILSGRWPASEAAPSERELAAQLNVTRHVVREALKRLQQAGLIRISQGGATMVMDWRTHAGLDMGFALIAAGVVPQAEIFRDTAVLRRTVGTDAARLCAVNASKEELGAVAAASAAYPKIGTLQEFQDAELAFWTAIMTGSHNITYRLALNTLMAAIEEAGAELVMNLNAESLTDRGDHVELAAALTARDPETAARLAHAQLSYLVDVFPPHD